MESFINECILTMANIFFGFIAAMLYDVFKIGRKVIHHYGIINAFQDVIYCAVLGFFWFKMMLNRNNGDIHMFYYLVTAFGVVIYEKIFSDAVVHTSTAVIRKIIKK